MLMLVTLLCACRGEEKPLADVSKGQAAPGAKPATDTVALKAPTADSTLVAERQKLELPLLTFNPDNLASADSTVEFHPSCESEETIPTGLIPAAARILSVARDEPDLSVVVDLVSVASVKPASGNDVCGASSLIVTPRVSRDTFRVLFYRWTSVPHFKAGPGMVHLTNGAPDDGPRVALVGLRPFPQTLDLQAATVEILRARIDSVRSVIGRGGDRPLKP
jgi:hypothetical protein